MVRVTKIAIVLPIAAVTGLALAIGPTAPAAAASHRAKTAAHQAGGGLYDIAPQGRGAVNSDDPSLTGGGSLGYNQNIYNW